jgi:hypothetical protein
MATCRARLGHRDVATHPGAGLRDRLARSWVRGLRRLEEVKDVLRARSRPEGEEPVIRIGEGSTPADRHETRVALFRENHSQHSFCPHLPNRYIAGSSISIADDRIAPQQIHRGSVDGEARRDHVLGCAVPLVCRR